jgi:hypothetical protein
MDAEKGEATPRVSKTNKKNKAKSSYPWKKILVASLLVISLFVAMFGMGIAGATFGKCIGSPYHDGIKQLTANSRCF